LSASFRGPVRRDCRGGPLWHLAGVHVQGLCKALSRAIVTDVSPTIVSDLPSALAVLQGVLEGAILGLDAKAFAIGPVGPLLGDVHSALPAHGVGCGAVRVVKGRLLHDHPDVDRKSTRLNS